jgi:hypothetical protein
MTPCDAFRSLAVVILAVSAFPAFISSPATAEAFTEQCRMSINNHLLISPK